MYSTLSGAERLSVLYAFRLPHSLLAVRLIHYMSRSLEVNMELRKCHLSCLSRTQVRMEYTLLSLSFLQIKPYQGMLHNHEKQSCHDDVLHSKAITLESKNNGFVYDVLRLKAQ
jgi:hypothetical protein